MLLKSENLLSVCVCAAAFFPSLSCMHGKEPAPQAYSTHRVQYLPGDGHWKLEGSHTGTPYHTHTRTC